MTKRHERELNEMSAVHSRETQNMLSDFNKAQEVLKDKISALQILYVHTVNTLCACVVFRQQCNNGEIGD